MSSWNMTLAAFTRKLEQTDKLLRDRAAGVAEEAFRKAVGVRQPTKPMSEEQTLLRRAMGKMTAPDERVTNQGMEAAQDAVAAMAERNL